jgi:TetR/AcrR family tetracycline transcriptional repressor
VTGQPRRRLPLTIDSIVDSARALIARDGLRAFSMRRLGTALGVDPMAIYHHVPNKSELLALITAQAIGAMEPAPADQPWDRRVRHWASTYWDVVVANRDLIAAGLADPVISAGGGGWVAPLREAVVASGIDGDLVEPNVWLIVDFVHGAGLGAGEVTGGADDDVDTRRWAFDRGLDTILAGVATLVLT